MDQQITNVLSQNDHDVLIELRTMVANLTGEVKHYNNFTTALETRVRSTEDSINRLMPSHEQVIKDVALLQGQIKTLDGTKNEALGGWKMLLLLIGALAGFVGIVIAALTYLVPHTVTLVK